MSMPTSLPVYDDPTVVRAITRDRRGRPGLRIVPAAVGQGALSVRRLHRFVAAI
jgi:hypothetical protein